MGHAESVTEMGALRAKERRRRQRSSLTDSHIELNWVPEASNEQTTRPRDEAAIVPARPSTTGPLAGRRESQPAARASAFKPDQSAEWQEDQWSSRCCNVELM